VGPAGPAGANHATDIAKLAAQVGEVFSELQTVFRQLETQLTRIAQIQAQLDHLTGVQPLKPHERLTMDRSDN
jgi:hypothetical protein